jgi:prepilin-type N-terminal cleavage/methylation domain-containing protein
MPISAVPKGRRLRSAGFSLLEVVTSLALVALASAAVMLAMGGATDPARAMAERLGARCLAAADHGMMLNRETALMITPEGFAFEELQEGGWRPLRGREGLGFHAWPDGVRPLVDESGPRPANELSWRATRFDRLGGAAPFRIVLASGQERWAVEADRSGGISIVQVE